VLGPPIRGTDKQVPGRAGPRQQPGPAQLCGCGAPEVPLRCLAQSGAEYSLAHHLRVVGFPSMVPLAVCDVLIRANELPGVPGFPRSIGNKTRPRGLRAWPADRRRGVGWIRGRGCESGAPCRRRFTPTTPEAPARHGPPPAALAAPRPRAQRACPLFLVLVLLAGGPTALRPAGPEGAGQSRARSSALPTAYPQPCAAQHGSRCSTG